MGSGPVASSCALARRSAAASGIGRARKIEGHADPLHALARRKQGPRPEAAHVLDEIRQDDPGLQASPPGPGDELEERKAVGGLPGFGGHAPAHRGDGRRHLSRRNPRQASVDAPGVGLEDRPLRRIQGLEERVGVEPDAQGARQPVTRDAGFTDDLCRRTPGQPPQPEHLGQTVLGVGKAEPEPGVGRRAGLDVGDAPGIPQHLDGARDSRYRDAAGRDRERLSRGRLPLEPLTCPPQPQHGEDDRQGRREKSPRKTRSRPTPF